jgi:hypothetical protein
MLFEQVLAHVRHNRRYAFTDQGVSWVPTFSAFSLSREGNLLIHEIRNNDDGSRTRLRTEVFKHKLIISPTIFLSNDWEIIEIPDLMGQSAIPR